MSSPTTITVQETTHAPDHLRTNRVDLVVARLTFITTVAAYAWFWTWFAWTVVISDGPEISWISLFGFLLAVDHVNHAWLLWIASRFEKIRPDAKADRSDRPRRVAMIATKAPSEPLEVLQRTLRAMLAQEAPACVSVDVWLADERPSPETLSWCASEGVRVSTRDGLEDYHRPEWPRRTRSKEGNLRYWYDTHGAGYDVVSQFDADHAPRPDYLSHVLWRFNDPTIGYVAMPNLSTNAPGWFGRARREMDGPFYGTSLGSMGARSDDTCFFMPSCTGSHYAVSTDAIRAIGGGLGPELDEDQTTTMMIAKAGFRGAYAVDAIADGDGPETTEDGLVQEFQWARSAALVFTRWLSTVFPGRNANAGAVFRATFIALWYATRPLWLVWFVGGPIVSMYTGWCTCGASSACAFNLAGLIIHATPAWIVDVGWDAYQKRRGWMRPSDAPAFSLLAIPYRVVRSPWITFGIFAGLAQLVCRRSPPSRVTNKAPDGVRRLPWAAMWPLHLLLAVFVGAFWAPIAFAHPLYNGFYVWLGQIIATSAAAACFVGHAIEQRGSFTAFPVDTTLYTLTISGGAASIVLAPALAASRDLVLSPGVANAVWIPHWAFSVDMWISVGFVAGSAVVASILVLLGGRKAPGTPGGTHRDPAIAVAAETPLPVSTPPVYPMGVFWLE